MVGAKQTPARPSMSLSVYLLFINAITCTFFWTFDIVVEGF